MEMTKKKKALVLSLAMAALMALPTTTFAQCEKEGGLFGTANTPASNGGFGDGLLRKNSKSTPASLNDGGLSNGDFGEEPNAPLGSGIAVLMGLGLGYVALKKKEDEQ